MAFEHDAAAGNGRGSGFRYPANFDAIRTVRFLRLQHRIGSLALSYGLETVALDDLYRTPYLALSYTWGGDESSENRPVIEIEGRDFLVRRNLFDFLTAAAARRFSGLLFVDAICINQEDREERRHQVRHMTRVYRNADEVIIWLGVPDPQQEKRVEALRQARPGHYESWTEQQWEGFRYLCHHPYWSRVWIIQEVLLASRISIWCGSSVLSSTLLGGISDPRSRLGVRRPSSSSQVRAPAELILAHRTRTLLRPTHDVLAQGTEVGTLDDLVDGMRRPRSQLHTYTSPVPDRLYELLRKFGRDGHGLQCSDARDRLYGLLGLLPERVARGVDVDYGAGVGHAAREALRVGLWELHKDHTSLASPETNFLYRTFYGDVRDAFGLGEADAQRIWREVLEAEGFRDLIYDEFVEAQWLQLLGEWNGEIKAVPMLRQLLDAGPGDHGPLARPDSRLFKLHERQRRKAEDMVGRLKRKVSLHRRPTTKA